MVLFTLGKNEPKFRPTTVDLTGRSRARSQNAWPSPDFDLMAVNSALSPMFHRALLQTFMGPFKKSWMSMSPSFAGRQDLARFYEKDSDRYETAHEFCDVLVVGSGHRWTPPPPVPGRSGARVVLVEQETEFGGQLLSERRPI